MREVIGLAPAVSLGIGIDVETFNKGLAADPDFIAQDAGSTEMGPYYLGTGTAFLPRASYKRDLSIMLTAARERNIPLLIGSCVTNGTDEQLRLTFDIVRELAREKGFAFRLAVIGAEPERSFIKRRLAESPFESLGPQGVLTPEAIERCSHVVAQMGVEPFVRALEAGADVVLAGRAFDDAIFAACPIFKGFDPGLAFHMGKIMECAGLAAVPHASGLCLVGRLRDDHFVVTPGDDRRRCTPQSAASHSFYQLRHPGRQPVPGGVNDLAACRFEALDQDSVRVSGSRFTADPPYRVKLEGAEPIGFRSLCLVGVRDPIMIGQIEELIEQMRGLVRKRFDEYREDEDYTLLFRLYGKNGVMGSLEPVKDHVPLELGIVIEAIAETQELANAVAMFARGSLQHTSYPGMVATAGNLAYPFSPFNVPVGPAYRFSVYHLMPLKDPCECFPMELIEVG